MAELGLSISPRGGVAGSCGLTIAPLHLNRTVEGDVMTLTLSEGIREEAGAGLVVTGVEAVGEGTVITWGVVPSVAGEAEAQSVNLGGIVYILG